MGVCSLDAPRRRDTRFICSRRPGTAEEGRGPEVAEGSSGSARFMADSRCEGGHQVAKLTSWRAFRTSKVAMTFSPSNAGNACHCYLARQARQASSSGGAQQEVSAAAAARRLRAGRPLDTDSNIFLVSGLHRADGRLQGSQKLVAGCPVQHVAAAGSGWSVGLYRPPPPHPPSQTPPALLAPEHPGPPPEKWQQEQQQRLRPARPI